MPTPPVPRGAFRRSCRKCGWATVAPTEGMADRRKRQHNCARQPVCPDCGGEKSLVATRCQSCASAKAGERIDRTPQPCHHKQARHQHGTHAAYTLDGCRCVDCARAEHTYETNRKRAHAYGRWTHWVDSEPLREHMRSLMEQGMGSKRIQEVGNLPSGTWSKLMYGVGGRPPTKRTRRDVAERILAIRLDRADGSRIPALGVARRLQALVALGWSQAKLAKMLGVLPANATDMVHGRRAVTVRRDREVRALYERLSMTLPPETNQRERIAASRARRQAKRLGWLPPLAWDDEQLDDPEFHPVAPSRGAVGYDHAVVERFIESGKRPRRLSHQETAEVVRRLRRAGVSTREMENRYGLKPERHKEEGKSA